MDVRAIVKGHRHGREVLKGMLSDNIESLSRVFDFRMIPSTRSDGQARAFSPQRHRQVLSLIGESQRNLFRCEHPLFTLGGTEWPIRETLVWYILRTVMGPRKARRGIV